MMHEVRELESCHKKNLSNHKEVSRTATVMREGSEGRALDLSPVNDFCP
jgi:hypothetical protein